MIKKFDGTGTANYFFFPNGERSDPAPREQFETETLFHPSFKMIGRRLSTLRNELQIGPTGARITGLEYAYPRFGSTH